MFTPPINHNKYNTRFDRVVLFIFQYRTTIIGYFGHPVYFLSQLFKKPVNAVWDKRGTRTEGEVWSVVVSLQCRNIASRTRQSTSSSVCVIPHSTAWCDTGTGQGLPTHRPDLLLLPVLVHNTTTLALALGERVEPEPRGRVTVPTLTFAIVNKPHTLPLYSTPSTRPRPFRSDTPAAANRFTDVVVDESRVIQRQSSGKRQILTPGIRFEDSFINVFVRVLKHSGRIHLFVDFRRRFIFYYSAS